MKQKWEYKRLGDVCDIICGQDYKSVLDDKGPYPIYGTGGVMGRSSQYRCPANSVIIGRKGSINNPLFVDEPFWNVDTAFGMVPKHRFLVSKYFFYFCRNYDFTKHDVAVTIPSLRRVDLVKIQVSIPPLDVQERIVAELDLLMGVIDKQKAELKELDTLAQSIFYDMFGDPIENPKGWDIDRLENLGYLGRGVSKHRPRNDPKLLGGSMPLIQTGDVANANYLIREYTSTYSDIGVAQSKVWPKGTLCITIAATIGKCAILDFDACFPDSVVGFTPGNKVCKDYIYFIFCNMQKMLEDYAPGVAQKNINLAILNALQIPVPPLSLQQTFADKIASIEKQKAAITQSMAETQKLLNYTMDKYFG